MAGSDGASRRERWPRLELSSSEPGTSAAAASAAYVYPHFLAFSALGGKGGYAAPPRPTSTRERVSDKLIN